MSPYISRYTTCHKWSSYPSIPLYHHLNQKKIENSNRYRKSRGSAVKYVTSSINSIGFEGLWAHIYEDILHVINGPATRVYHHIITRIHEKFKNLNWYRNSRITAVKYVTSSVNSVCFQGLLFWAHTYQDILHVINGPATRVHHHIIIRIQK